MRIEIVAPPSDEAPAWAGETPLRIRQAWVGCEFDEVRWFDGEAALEARGGPPVPVEGKVMVPWREALEALQHKSLDAARWYQMRFPAHPNHLLFGRQFFKILEDLPSDAELCIV